MRPFRVSAGGFHYGGYAWENDIFYEYPNWMKGIPDNTPLSALSIPGTHESMAIHSSLYPPVPPWTYFPICQQMYLENQLRSGIRALDIRLAIPQISGNDNLKVFHGISNQYADFNDVLRKVVEFLIEQPTETVLMRITETNALLMDPAEFEVRVNKYFAEWKYEPTGDFYGDYVWWPSNASPELGEVGGVGVRGKIVILDDFSGSYLGCSEGTPTLTKYGLKYGAHKLPGNE